MVNKQTKQYTEKALAKTLSKLICFTHLSWELINTNCCGQKAMHHHICIANKHTLDEMMALLECLSGSIPSDWRCVVSVNGSRKPIMAILI